MKNIIAYLTFVLFFVACAGAPKIETPSAKAEPKTPSAEPTPSMAPDPALTSAIPPTPENVVKADNRLDLPSPAVPKARPQPQAKIQQVWKLKNSKLTGPGVWPKPILISKVKNEKTPGTTSEICYNYGKFSVVEMRSTDEVGSAEVTVRHQPGSLCAPEFKGRAYPLRITEGYFAGAAGGVVMIDGADSSEGQTEFQIFSIENGTELIKSFRHPTEEFMILRERDQVSLEYFARMEVKCELAHEGEGCWKKVLAAHKAKPAPMPDCKTSFAAAKVPVTEPALVFMRASVKPLKKAGSSQPEFLGGKATCVPAP